MKRIKRVWKKSMLWAILLSLIVAGGMAYYTYVYENDRYTASASLYAMPLATADGQTLPVDTLLKDSQSLIHNQKVIKDTEAKIRPTTFAGDRLVARVSGETDSRVLVVSVSGEDARACQRAAGALSEVFGDYLVEIGAAVKVEVTQKDELPTQPTGPNRILKIAITFGAGFIALFLLFLLILPANRYVSCQEELPADLDTPVIGRISDFRKDLSAYFSKRRPTGKPLYALTGKAVIEDVRQLALNLGYAARGGALRSVVICSSQPDEGKSTLSVLLGSELAMQDKSVLLVDMDSYSPSIGKLLGVRCRADLVDLFSGEASIEKVLMETPIHGLYYIGNRHIGMSATQLVASSAFTAFINHAYEQFDYVLFDTPPVALYVDAMALGGAMDATVLVAGDRLVKPELLKRSVTKLKQSGAKLYGIAFTLVKQKREKLYRDYEDSYAAFMEDS